VRKMNGVMGRHSDVMNARPESDESKQRLVDELKRRGNMAFKAKSMEEARQLYSKAIHHNDKIVALYGNRCAVYLQMKRYQDALKDAEKAIELDASWVKGHYRKGQIMDKMGRHEESAKSYDEAARLKPDDTRMKKLADKQRLKAKEKPKVAEKKAQDSKKPPAAPRPPKIVRSSASSSSSSSSSGKKSGGAMRGYKITKDGKKTSYFTTEWDDNTKELYKDLGPKKVESANVVEPTNTGDGSTWNSAGTYEECDCSTWAKNRLKELLDSKNVGVAKHSSEGGALEISKLKNFECDASRPVIRNKRRYIYEVSFELEFKVALPAHMKGDSNKPIRGRLIYPEVTSDSDRPFYCEIKVSNAPKNVAERFIRKVLAKDMDSRVQEKLATFDREHRTRK